MRITLPTLLVAILLALPGFVMADSSNAPLNVPAYEVRGTFAVPESPAFVLLDETPDELLRPTSVNELTATASRFLSGGQGLSLPRSVGIEFSPGLLIGGRTLTVGDYLQRRALYRTRVSLATHRPDETSTATEIALGIRLTLLDGGDLRANNEYRAAIVQISERMVRALSPTVTMPTDAESSGVINTTGNASYEALSEELRDTIKRYSDDNWNKEKLEAAIAILAASPDTTGSDLRTASFAGWLTYATPVGHSGQFLIGMTGRAHRTPDSTVFRGNSSISSRLYFGANDAKFLLEGRAHWEDRKHPNWGLHTGGEMAVGKGLWLTFTGGIDFGSGSEGNNLVARYSLRYELPSL